MVTDDVGMGLLLFFVTSAAILSRALLYRICYSDVIGLARGILTILNRPSKIFKYRLKKYNFNGPKIRICVGY